MTIEGMDDPKDKISLDGLSVYLVYIKYIIIQLIQPTNQKRKIK